MRLPSIFALLSLPSLLLLACSGGGGGNSPSGQGGGSPASSGSLAQGSGGDGAGGAGGGSGGSGGASAGGHFRHGVNYGYTPGITDEQSAILARRAGANSARISLPERHLDMWGYDIEKADNESYVKNGITNSVCFLSGPTAAHSSAPQGTPDWELDHYIPRNLHEPIFLGDGSVNPENYWANYVFQTVSAYKPWIKVWSVWNEPDWVADWQFTQTWGTEPPTKEQLVRFNGSIYDYVRMLRITHEVAKKADPEAKVAVGGLGYPTFLAAVLRYSDDPAGGAVNADHPEKGGAYFDVIDMHYYPIFSPGNSDQGVDGLIALKKEFQAVLDAAGASPKAWVITETGAPRIAKAGSNGGPEYARNYLLKAMTAAQREGVMGIDWFILSDGKDPSAGPFDSMGLYQNLEGIPSVDQAVLTDTGHAYATLGTLLDDARYDAASTEALMLPAGVDGAAFRVSEGPAAKRAFVLWARKTGGGEDATATYDLAASGKVRVHAWDSVKNGGAGAAQESAGGKVTLSLGSTPLIVIEE
jgi:hypothetical protein